MPERGLIAGQGRLPELVAQAHLDLVVGAMEPHLPQKIPVYVPFRLEALGLALAELKRRGVTRLCLAGQVKRPDIDLSLVDPLTAPLLAQIQAVMAKGDDTLLRAVIAVLEGQGFVVEGAHEWVPDLMPAPGVLAGTQPDDSSERDAARGFDVLRALGAADVGQACVIAKGQVVAVEALAGTEWMLNSLKDLPESASAKGGIFVKAAKPGQDMRVDVPTIGPGTVDQVADAGLAGMVVPQGQVMVLDLDIVRQKCVDRGVFLWVTP